MPIYEYQCVKCKKILEVMHKYEENRIVVCKKCKQAMQKIISTGGFVLKGDGFFKSNDCTK